MSFVAVIIANPAKSNLRLSMIEAIRNIWQGSGIKWLNEEIAAEFSLERYPENLDEVRADLALSQLDIAVVSESNRRKRLFVADMDSTIIEQECLDELAAHVGIGEQVAEVTARAMNGEIDFDAALKLRVSWLKGLEAKNIDTVWKDRISFTPGARALVWTQRANGTWCVLVSGGFTEFTSRVSQSLGFHQHFANQLIIKDGKLSGVVKDPILGRNAKKHIFDDLIAERNIKPCATLAVGDGSNDLAMLATSGLGVAFRAKPCVAEHCPVRIVHSDLTALLYLQGYNSTEFCA